MEEVPQGSMLFADSNRGIFIPQHFAESIAREFVSGVSAEEWRVLEAGPEHDSYWDAWNAVESNARLKASDGVEYYLLHSGDLWLVPVKG